MQESRLQNGQVVVRAVCPQRASSQQRSGLPLRLRGNAPSGQACTTTSSRRSMTSSPLGSTSRMVAGPAAMDHTELGETVLLNAQQARGYTAPAVLHALASQMSASVRARVPPDGGDPLGDSPRRLK